jgi:hypothetical protein
MHQREGVRGDDERGIAPIPGTRRLEIVSAPDSGEGGDPNRTIRRARIADPLRRMVRAGMPYRCFLAAERFRSDIEVAQAGRGVGSQLRERVNVGPPSGADMPLGALAAAARVRAVWRDVIGLTDTGIIGWCVVPRGDSGPAFGTLDDYAKEFGIRRQRAAEQLIASLERLADHYGFGNAEAPRGFA